MEIKVKSKDFPDGITVNYDMPDSIEACIKRYGDETTYNLLTRQLTLGAQAIARNHIDNETEAQSAIDNWVPGVRQPGAKKSPLERASSLLGKLSPEELQALVEKARAAKKAAK